MHVPPRRLGLLLAGSAAAAALAVPMAGQADAATSSSACTRRPTPAIF